MTECFGTRQPRDSICSPEPLVPVVASGAREAHGHVGNAVIGMTHWPTFGTKVVEALPRFYPAEAPRDFVQGRHSNGKLLRK
ncbi:hypothetical protein TGRH88_024040 [Toxoplasma gondii]|uniref:Uncharacterized protein n=1 Tax=Toxoplasma gondii TaxID=5811 RepID=A0A7J6K9R8_TOXGO|nr:hypothetical protein TGRH88_024040 [Toxoplasma gondii]